MNGKEFQSDRYSVSATNLKDGYFQPPTVATKRFCQLIELNADTLDGYKYWHDSRNIWKEIPEGIRRAGILDMEIYVRGNIGIMILTTPVEFDWDGAFGALATFERQAEWEDFVSRFQAAGSGRSDEKWQLCERIFSLAEVLEQS
jgi:L-rhamnose mutarotase